VSQILLSLRISLQVTIQILSSRARQKPGESPKFGDQLSSKLGTFLSNPISEFLKPPEPPLGFEELKRVPGGNTFVSPQKKKYHWRSAAKIILVRM